MNITWEEPEGAETPIRDIPDGTTFTGQIAHYPCRLFLCAGGDAKIIVSLDYPNHTWTVWDEEHCATVKNYKEVSATIHVREQE